MDNIHWKSLFWENLKNSTSNMGNITVYNGDVRDMILESVRYNGIYS